MRKSTKPYVGMSVKDHKIVRTYFRSAFQPTEATHGHLFSMVMGPFRTAHAAKFQVAHGNMNPHTQHVSDTERVAKLFRQLPDGTFEKIAK